LENIDLRISPSIRKNLSLKATVFIILYSRIQIVDFFDRLDRALKFFASSWDKNNMLEII
jgi:hypothetical protein